MAAKSPKLFTRHIRFRHNKSVYICHGKLMGGWGWRLDKFILQDKAGYPYALYNIHRYTINVHCGIIKNNPNHVKKTFNLD